MMPRPLPRHFRHAIRDIRANSLLHITTLIIISLSILVVGLFGLMVSNVDSMMTNWTSGIRILAYASSSANTTDLARMEAEMARIVPIGTIKRVSKEEGLARLQKKYKDQKHLFSKLKENPLPDLFVIEHAPTDSGDNLDTLVAKLADISGIDSVTYGKKWVQRILKVIQIVKMGISAMGLLFLLITTFIVANTIRLALYTKRDEIEIMRLIGAEEPYIRAPFTIIGLLVGGTGGLFGIGFIYGTYRAFLAQIAPLLTSTSFEIRFLPTPWILVILTGSLLVGWIGCQLSFRKHL